MHYYSYLRPLLFKLPAEPAHVLAVNALRLGLLPSQTIKDNPVQIGNLRVRNKVGMAAGFDKNGDAIAGLFNQGFGFVECGTVTPRAQVGNPKPRLFRLKEDEAVINRMGFNNAGLDALLANLERQKKDIQKARSKGARLGINIGKNKETVDANADYLTMLEHVAEHADYVTLNISSPNTPGLRDLQEGNALTSLLDAVCNKREAMKHQVPLWLKLAPDLEDEACESIAATVRNFPIDTLIISNTTISRPDSLQSSCKNEQGGLSGKPLMTLATDRLRRFKELTDLPLIGVGGIASAEDAKTKLAAGATAVQLYSALVYQGFGLVQQIGEKLV